jgi:cobalt-zinc-cadmium resistance protein CzcA
LETQLQNALQQYQQDVQQFNYYQKQALPNANEIVSSAQLGYTNRRNKLCRIFVCFANSNRYSIELPKKYSAGKSICNQYLFNNQSIRKNEIQYKKFNRFL